MNDIVPVPRTPPARTTLPRALRARRAATPARKQTNVRVWLPITPLVIALSPLAILALPIVALSDVARRTRAAAMMVHGTRVLLALGGTEVDIRSRKANLRIRIF